MLLLFQSSFNSPSSSPRCSPYSPNSTYSSVSSTKPRRESFGGTSTLRRTPSLASKRSTSLGESSGSFSRSRSSLVSVHVSTVKVNVFARKSLWILFDIVREFIFASSTLLTKFAKIKVSRKFLLTNFTVLASYTGLDFACAKLFFTTNLFKPGFNRVILDKICNLYVEKQPQSKSFLQIQTTRIQSEKMHFKYY